MGESEGCCQRENNSACPDRSSSMPSAYPTGSEIERIRAEYARRGREIPQDFYSWSRPVNQFFHCQTLRACVAALVREALFPLTGKTIVDIGCGSGEWLTEFIQWGARCADVGGIDLRPDKIEEARKRLPEANLHTGDARRLPFPSNSADLVSQFTVFTSILEPHFKKAVAAEMLRVLKPGGLILWYDFRFNNPSNSSVRGIKSEEIRTLFPGCRIHLRRVTLAPPVARFVVPITWIGALLLEKIPILRTHYLGAIRKTAI
jgi:SAM-dependent methyltransferase